MKLFELFENKKPILDFFHALTKMNRMFNGYPQEYGFHHHHDEKEYHGTFVTRDCRGKVFKIPRVDGSATYICKCESENLLDKHVRHEQILEAVKASSPAGWSFVSMVTFKKSKDPCYAVEHSKTNGDVDINVHHDTHPSIK